MEIYVRRAERGDIPQMLPLLDQLDAWHRELYPQRFRKLPDGGRQARDLVREMAESSNEYWVAVKSGNVLGVALFMHRQITGNPLLVPQDYLLVDMLVVRENLRGQGIGKLLMAQAKQRAQELRYPRVEVKVYTGNQGAMQFYRDLGYQSVMQTLEIDCKGKE